MLASKDTDNKKIKYYGLGLWVLAFSTDWTGVPFMDWVKGWGFLRFRVQGLSGDLGISFLLIQRCKADGR